MHSCAHVDVCGCVCMCDYRSLSPFAYAVEVQCRFMLHALARLLLSFSSYNSTNATQLLSEEQRSLQDSTKVDLSCRCVFLSVTSCADGQYWPVCVCVCACAHVCGRIHAYMLVCMYVRECVRTCMRLCMRAFGHARMRACAVCAVCAWPGAAWCGMA